MAPKGTCEKYSFACSSSHPVISRESDDARVVDAEETHHCANDRVMKMIDDADGCRATDVVSTRETSEGLTDVIVIFIVDVDNKKKVSTFVIDCAKPVRIVGSMR